MAGLLKFISFFTKYVTLWVIICAVFAYLQLDFLFFRNHHAQHGPFHVAQRL